MGDIEPSAWSQSPVAETLAITMEALYPGLSARRRFALDKDILIVSYREDFDWLWDLPSGLFQWLESGSRTIVLVWDETPHVVGVGEVNILDHVTAFDWVVGLTLTASGAPDAQQWRIVVMDLASQNHTCALSVRLLSLLQQSATPLLPGVKIFTPWTVEEMLRELASPITPHNGLMDAGLLRCLWAADLANPAFANDRHAIVNLIGPRVLLAGMSKTAMPPSASSPVVHALDQLMRVVGLVTPNWNRELAPWISREVWGPFVDQFVLVDDMSDLGWSDFLRAALGLGNELLECILEHWRGIPYIQKRIVVFLDLRLFARAGFDAELRFYTELVKMASGKLEGTPGLKWAGFSASELEGITKCIDARDFDDYHYGRALTLLPRLMALESPSLPIVMFSSTGRKEVVDALKGYQNIITDFEKPRFFGDGSSSVLTETRRRFERALGEALRMARGREACLSLERNVSALREMPPGGKVAELYFDESGAENEARFCVGGMALVYPSEDAVRQLDRALANKRLTWRTGHLEKEPNNYAPHLAEFDRTFRELGISVLAFALVNQQTHVYGPSEPGLVREDWLDHLFRSMIADALEAMLFDVTYRQTPEPESISIHLATRVAPIPGASEQVRQQLLEDWGLIFVRDAPQKYYVLSHQEARPIARAVQYRRPDVVLPIHRARAVRLHHSPDKHHPNASEIHHLADWLARLGNRQRRSIPEVALRWFANGFLQARTPAFFHWLNATRAADVNDWPCAISEAAQAVASEETSPDLALSFGRWARRRAATWPQHLNGIGFQDLCRRLEWPPRASQVGTPVK